MRSLLAVMGLLAMVTDGSAQLLPLEVLDQTAQSVTIGNSAFSVVIQNSGRLHSVQAGGTEYVSFVALYTNPTALDTGQTVRAVQGETGEERGIGPLPAEMSVERRGQHYFIAISQTAARSDLCEGKPLYELHQTVEIGPNGVVRLRYQFDWLRFFQVNRATIYLALSGPVFAELPFWADYTNERTHGAFIAETQYEAYAGLSGDLRSLVVDCPAGPFHLWMDAAGSVTSSHWGERFSTIGLHVPGTASNQPMYAGVTSVVEFTVKLPLP